MDVLYERPKPGVHNIGGGGGGGVGGVGQGLTLVPISAQLELFCPPRNPT
jgi:hypothetical protein